MRTDPEALAYLTKTLRSMSEEHYKGTPGEGDLAMYAAVVIEKQSEYIKGLESRIAKVLKTLASYVGSADPELRDLCEETWETITGKEIPNA